MGNSPSIGAFVIAAGLFGFTLLMGGCEMSQSVSTQSLLQHQVLIDLSGLKPTETADVVKAYIAPPQKWDELAVKKSALFTDAQWRAPSHMTAVGVAYVHLPLPLPASAIVWLAKREYSKKSNDGKILAQWTDPLGRPWFEAENSTYHVRGYAVTKGWDAWIIYCGYKTADPPSATDLSIAGRCLETILPIPFAPERPPESSTAAVASAP